ncbi:micrococcal nuclease [Acidovorax sp. HMWF018]|jgi:micrococcal nuclease|uniref:thermonuclease family protein n=1 Tax=Acidovorax sp. HMWF018 TaxID=2056855 RepID=UPI000D39BC08|nr:thermonuclease family protein [Acidovorax sp. HMWF018]PTT38836.1 micrococcal nuclease [Acidovorax sp. HMWF018]
MAVVGRGVRAFWLAVLLAFTGLAHADFSGQVVAILDGDTIDVLVDQRPVRVRLAQIDAPEKRQAFGTRSREALAALVFRKTVLVGEEGRDRYGRVIGTIHLGNLNVNEKMVREGMAWVYRKYSKDKMLYELEDQAKVHRLGLWVDPSPEAPWAYRRRPQK